MDSATSPLHLYAAGVGISFIHAVLPSHWLPFVLLGRAERWSERKILGVLLTAGGGHVFIAGLLALGVAAFGKVLSHAFEHFSTWVASGLLFAWGGAYLFKKQSSHTHPSPEEAASHYKIQNRLAAASLFVMLSFSPCEAIIPVFFAASRLGWRELGILILVMSAATLGGMAALAYSLNKGLEKIRWAWLEKHENRLIGAVLIVLGVFVLCLPLFK